MGGHSEQILKLLNKDGQLVCIDHDVNAFKHLTKKFANDQRVKIFNDNFINIISVLKNIKIQSVDGILADLGVSSVMFDDATRGFSYHKDAKLDMRMNQQQELDSHYVLNNYGNKELVRIFKIYGEIRNPQKTTHEIIRYRKNKTIDTTLEFVDIIKKTIHKSELFKHKHPATKYFQAIRIEVNNELNNLKTFLESAISILKQNGILLIISFHSMEDRIVKQYFHKISTSQIPKEVPIKNEQIYFNLLNKKSISPTEKEILNNNRARSAKLRGVVRI
jgi:16S rRNA (cytosine1402-N4)-methyltransferase